MSISIELAIALVLSSILVVLYNYGKSVLQGKEKQLLWFFQVLGLFIPIFLIVNALAQSWFSDKIDFGKEYENLPTYLMFIVTLVTIYLLYRTLNEQRRATQIAEFENRFFKFMDYHRENVSQLRYRNPKSSEEIHWEGNQVFTVIYYEVKELLDEFFKEYHARKPHKVRESIDFIYQCVFYGAGKDGIKILEANFKHDHECLEFIKKLQKKKASYSIKDDKEKEVQYSGHVRRLGHYFRNIYQAVKYVDDKDFLDAKQKYSYMTHFRAQMSVYEQAVFFFNSLSRLGDSWEWVHYNKQIPIPKDKKKRIEVFNKLWITKYDLIRNTLNHDGVIADGISIGDYYPLLDIEGIEECSLFGVLRFKDNSKHICRFCFNEKYFGYNNESCKEKLQNYFGEPSNKEALRKFECDEKDCISMPTIIELRTNLSK